MITTRCLLMPTAEEPIRSSELDAGPNHRYASFDYCFNYFQSFRSKSEIAAPQNMEKSCMQLGAYLASWGMFRASSFLLQKKSMRHFQNVIEVIASKQQAPLWRIDCHEYSEHAKVHLQNGYQAIRCAVVPSREAHLTLVTKIMLGVFGCVPAFDSRFTDTDASLWKDTRMALSVPLVRMVMLSMVSQLSTENIIRLWIGGVRKRGRSILTAARERSLITPRRRSWI